MAKTTKTTATSKPTGKSKTARKGKQTATAPARNGDKTPNRCLCGCGGATRSRFCMGHDARYHGRIKRLKDGRLTLRDLEAEIGAEAIQTYRDALATTEKSNHKE